MRNIYNDLFGVGYHFRAEIYNENVIICCPPKNGCSALKFAILAQRYPEFANLISMDTEIVHRYTNKINIKNSREILDAKLIFIMRDPVERLISGFVSKFVLHPEENILGSICNLSEVSAEDMTFRQFAHTIYEMPDWYLDPHFCSQSRFLLIDPDNYEFIKLGGESKRLLDSITLNSYSEFSTQEKILEANRFGKIVQNDKVNLEEKESAFSDLCVKQIRYLRTGGAPLLKEYFIFSGLESLCKERFKYDYLLGVIPPKSRSN